MTTSSKKKILDYDNPVITPDLSEDQIMDLFANNEQFAMLWLRLMITNSHNTNLSIAEQRKVLSALRQYLTMLSNMLAGTEVLFEHKTKLSLVKN